jgi:methionyl-tRNA synthetase
MFEIFNMGEGAGIIFYLIVVWSIIWKGIALWKAARRGSKGWYIALLIVNTAGILEILYIFFFSKKKAEDIRKGVQ